MRQLFGKRLENILFLSLSILMVILMVYTGVMIDNLRAEINTLKAENNTLRQEAQLDPCPVCDGHNTHIYYDDEHDISIKCEDCGTTFGFYQDLSDALAIWNNVKG
ncbi:MAG: Lar family restriction alleviation protein [Acholeplasmatales bacterium]|nr:Lar family restriction alleviation protein [Acholeplasmatales bacterium]